MQVPRKRCDGGGTTTPETHVPDRRFATVQKLAKTVSYFKHVNYDYFKDIEETKKDFHTVQVLVQYHKPLHFEDTVEIGTKIKNIGNTSMTWIMGMFNKKSGDLVSSCEAVHVYTDQTTMKPTLITGELKKKLNF